MKPTNEEMIEMYKKMVTIRDFEYKISELFLNATIGGDLHLSVGEEACSVGVCAALRNDDTINVTHRGHGECLAKGADVKNMMAEFFGKTTGICKGKGGSMHLADFKVGMLGASGIVGGGIPQSVGAGLAMKLRGTDQVAVSFFGDGASNQGTFHESLNLAAVWHLPVIFVCENNQYAESTHVSKAMLVKNVADRAVAYGMPGVIVDGMDVLAVYDKMSDIVAETRKGKGPTLLECKTYRFEGHEVGDPQEYYRSKEEVEEWKKKCPIKRMRKYLIDNKILKEHDVDKIDKECTELIEEAVKFAEQSPLPEPKEAYEDVFVSPYY